MLTLRLAPSSEITQDILERLWQDVLPYAAEEIERMGSEEALKQTLFDLRDLPVVKYEIDGFVVGIASTYIKEFEGKNYLFYRFPFYGKDQNGSRAWFYSEDNQREGYEMLKRENLAGIMVVQNPKDKVTKASTTHLGTFNKYLKPVRYVSAKEASLFLLDDSLIICVYDVMEE